MSDAPVRSADATPAQELPPCGIVITQALIDAYAAVSGDFNSVHVDPEAGTAAGFGGTIAHGCIPIEPLFQSVCRWLGIDVLPPDATLRLRYRAPSRPGDTIRSQARVVAAHPLDDARIRHVIAFACVNQHGTTVVDGECEVSSRSTPPGQDIVDAKPPRYTCIALSIDGRIARLTLDRPDKLNALDPVMLDELLDALARVERTPGVNALFLQASGRMFSAGVDLGTPFFMENVDDDSVFAGTRLLNDQHRVIQALFDLPVVTIAALNGDACGGGGLGLAMACDLRVSVRGARFWMVPGMLDVIQDFGLSWMVQRLAGPSRALQMALLGSRVDAPTAQAWGLVNELVDDAPQLAARMDEIAAQLSGMGTDALRMLKLVLRNGERSQLREQLGVEAVANGLTFQSREFADKKAAYLAKMKAPRK